MSLSLLESVHPPPPPSGGFPHAFHPSLSVLSVDREELTSITGMIMIEKGLRHSTNERWRDICVMVQEELAGV